MQLWKNSFFVFLSLAIRVITNFLINVCVFRLYGMEAFGQFSIAFNVANMCLIIADFGFDVLLTAEIASNRERAGEVARKYFSIKLILATIASVVMFLVYAFLPLSSTSKSLILVLIAYMVLATFFNFFSAFFRGFERFEYETKISFVTSIILIISLLALGSLKLNLVYLMSTFVLVRVLGLVLAVPLSSKLANSKIFLLDFKGIYPLIKKVFVYGFSFLFGNLFFQLDTLLIGMWLSDTAAGIYRNAFLIMIMMLMIPDIAISSSLPKLSRAYIEDRNKWENLSRIIYKFLLVFAMPVSIITYFYPELILTITFGAIESYDAVTILRIFAFVLFIRFIVEPFGLMLTTSNRQLIRMVIVISATVLSFILNYLFVFTYGLISVAYVSLAVNLFVGIVYVLFNVKQFTMWLLEIRNLSIVAFSFLLATLIYLSSSNYFGLALCFISFPLFVYFIGFSKKERDEIIASFPLSKFRIVR